MLHTVLAWCMIAFGLLLIYDFISLGIRVGFGRRYASAPLLGLAVCAVFGAQLAGVVVPPVVDAFFSSAALVFLAGFIAYLAGTFLCVRRPPRCDWKYVVVLGAALRQRRNPSPLLKSRLEVGRLWWHMPYPADAKQARQLTEVASESVMPGAPHVELPEAGSKAAQARFVVTSGGQGPDEDIPEAIAMRDYLVSRGVPADRVLTETRSRTTWENLANVKKIVDGREAGTEPDLDDATTARTDPTGALHTSAARTAVQTYADASFDAGQQTKWRNHVGARRRKCDEDTGDDRSEAAACLIVTNDFHAFRTWLWAHRLHLPVAGVIGKPTRLYYLVGSLPRDYLAVLKGYKTEVVAVAAFLFAVCLLALL